MAINPLTYLLSYLFAHPTSAYIWIFTIYMFIGILFQIIMASLEFFDLTKKGAEDFLLLFAPFMLTRLIHNVGKQNGNRKLCEEACNLLSCSGKSWTCDQMEQCCGLFEN